MERNLLQIAKVLLAKGSFYEGYLSVECYTKILLVYSMLSVVLLKV